MGLLVFKFGPDRQYPNNFPPTMADTVRYVHIQHGAKSLDNGCSMFNRWVSRNICTTLYIVHAVYCSGQRQGLWMLFLSERWRGESLL